MKTNEQIIKAINNRIDRIIEFQDKIEPMMTIDETLVNLYFKEEAIKSELLALLDYIEESNGKNDP